MSQNQSITWKPVIGYDLDYTASDTGLIRSKTKILAPYQMANGYVTVHLKRGEKWRPFLVHRVIAEAFIPNPEQKATVNHKNGVKTDNRTLNLEWASQSENNQHANDTGLREQKGELNHMAKLTSKQVQEIRRKYKPWEYTQQRLAEEYGVTQTLISQVILDKIWILDKTH